MHRACKRPAASGGMPRPLPRRRGPGGTSCTQASTAPTACCWWWLRGGTAARSALSPWRGSARTRADAF
eukprot:11227337-Lingulodinium_polyedra.AAC.1